MVASAKSNRSRTPKKPTSTAHTSKKPVKANQSILSFFKKSDKQETSLFVGAAPEVVNNDDIYSADEADRYNEADSPNKRRRISPDPEALPIRKEFHGNGLKVNVTTKVEDIKSELPSSPPSTKNAPRPKYTKSKVKTPFVVDSDSEDEVQDDKKPKSAITQCAEPTPINEAHSDDHTKDQTKDQEHRPPILKQQDSTCQNFDDLADYDHDEASDMRDIEGEEMRFMRFAREQARLEAEADGFSSEDLADDPLDDGSIVESCPICNGSLSGISPDEATRHVNSCLDGNPIPLPKREAHSTDYQEDPEKDDVKNEDLENHEDDKDDKDAPPVKTDGESPKVALGDVSKRSARAAVPRPGQANPFELKAPSTATTKSAFSKLMSNNVEDTAWATAAAAEHASRGRPAYERTCPFYKIMPGFFICVDAFRYGAVQGCKAYFLSHFHSDHYIGLTGSWRHGPIYCSKVTGSLVKQQLRTAAKWVVELEFDKSYDIPGTEGATVTMIPANHCPGSSLFLFEKIMTNGPTDRVQRILHCGDFRACLAHVNHSLLKPDIVDSISGKIKQQKIDICYLDTTYLNPRYSFPPQDDVIKACADLCGGLSPDPACQDDIWERSANGMGQSVSKFFPKTEGGEKANPDVKKGPPQRLLVICGTYSIGKERICIAIAKALKSKIFASPGKMKICKQLDCPELAALLTSDPMEAQVHMQMLMEIRAETLQEYLNSYKPYFTRIVGFRPSGWNFRPAGKAIGANTSPGSIQTEQILHGKGWRSRFSYRDFIPQRGSTKEAMCFGVPYSEHSSFRELAMFMMSLRIEKVVPTVNVGSEQSRKRMKGWLDRWMADRRKGGLMRPLIEGEHDDEISEKDLWDGKSGKGGGAFW